MRSRAASIQRLPPVKPVWPNAPGGPPARSSRRHSTAPSRARTHPRRRARPRPPRGSGRVPDGATPAPGPASRRRSRRGRHGPRGGPSPARCRPAARRAGTAPGARASDLASAASSTSFQLSSRHSTICSGGGPPGQRAERSEAERSGDVQVEQIGQASAGRLLRRQAPEDVAQVAVGRELSRQAFGQRLSDNRRSASSRASERRFPRRAASGVQAAIPDR